MTVESIAHVHSLLIKKYSVFLLVWDMCHPPPFWSLNSGFHAVLYCLSHASSPFYFLKKFLIKIIYYPLFIYCHIIFIIMYCFFDYFGNRIFLFAQASLNHDPVNFKLPVVTEMTGPSPFTAFFH
jgi:hypothetical protein